MRLFSAIVALALTAGAAHAADDAMLKRLVGDWIGNGMFRWDSVTDPERLYCQISGTIMPDGSLHESGRCALSTDSAALSLDVRAGDGGAYSGTANAGLGLRKPVLLKRGLSATLEELLLSAEYLLAEGNYEVILCERGVRTFADHTRNTLDLSSVPYVQRISHLPILVDPSHGTGKRSKVLPLSRAAVAVGADGLLIEVHHQPELALSDGPQAILPEMFAELVDEVRRLAPVVGRTV